MSKGIAAKVLLVAVTVVPALTSTASDARKRERVWNQTMDCPTDAPVLLGSAGAAGRFTALAGCGDVRVVPEADLRQTAETDTGDYVVRATQRDAQGRMVDGLQSVGLGGSGSDVSEGDVRVTNDYTTTGVPVVRIAPVERAGAGGAGVSGVAPVRAVPVPQMLPNATLPPVRTIPVAAVQPIALTIPASGLGEQLLDLHPSRTTPYDREISDVARRQRVDPLLLHAVIKHESAYRPGVVSRAGAIGMMQVMPATGRTLGLAPGHLVQPRANIEAGARLIRKLADKYGSDFRLVLAAYNAGEGAVAKYGNQVPPYAETQAYVRDVLGEYRRLATENGLQLGQGN